jgi:hypothetical protein
VAELTVVAAGKQRYRLSVNRYLNLSEGTRGRRRPLASRPPLIERRRLRRAMIRLEAASPEVSLRQAIFAIDMPDEDFTRLSATWAALNESQSSRRA